MIEQFVDDVGVAAAASTAIAIAIDRQRPRYLVGALIGIPAALAIAQHVPDVIAHGLGGAYLGGLIGYAASSIAGADERSRARTSIATTVAGVAVAYPLLHYL